MKFRIFSTMALAVAASGCASQASSIQASYVSPVLYQNLSCSQLALEAQAVSSRAQAAAGVQNKKAGQDAAVMAVGLIVFWPALFFTSGDGMAAGDVARLKGEMQAIEAASIYNKCGLKFDKEPPKPKTKSTAANL
jgi:hypothetical protein